MAPTFSSSEVGPEVFINFRGDELRKTFISHLHHRLRRDGINAFIDSDEEPGRELGHLFKRIEESKIALAVLSSRYTESHWCLEELVKMKECSMKGEGCNNNLFVIPILYKVQTSTVSELDGHFGLNLWNLWRLPGRGRGRDNRIVKWNEALEYLLSKNALILAETSCKEDDFLSKIVTSVKNALSRISMQRGQNPKPHSEKGEKEGSPKPHAKCLSRASSNTEPQDTSLKQLGDKLDVECNDEDETRIVGVVGMPGIGKTYLVEKLMEKLKRKINHCVLIKYERERLMEQGPEWFQERLVEGLIDPDSRWADEAAPEDWKTLLKKVKVVVILDNVIVREQINVLLENSDWINKGSKIVITTRDKSLVEGLVSHLYEVPGLNEREGLALFMAQFSTTLGRNFMDMSRMFVEFAGGNPLALKEFGEELNGKGEELWVTRLGTLTQGVRKELMICFNQLDQHQKDAFLDIACLFRSQDESYVKSLLDSLDPESTESGHEFRDLVDKFFIGVCDGQVEMHDLLFTMAKELVETSGETSRMFLSNCAELENKEGRDKVRGIVLDMSKTDEMPIKYQSLVGMSSLRYLKVYDSLCPSHSETQCNLNLPDGLEFPKDNIIRYLHWVKFPGKELPSNFEPTNLIDLRLPYSKITSVWRCAKVAPNLKWVDLSHSRKLSSLLGLSEAPNLLKLNLEGCTSLKELPEEMQEMKNLLFLNLRGCTSLSSLPTITIDSLTTLILTGCSNLRTFKVISKNLETLYLNGTAIDGLPPAIGNLQKLILLNLKDCKNLATLPDCVGKLKSLEELKLSRCSELKNFSVDKDNMVKLRVLLLDETSIAEMPCNIIYLSLLRRLCLSRNDTVLNIQFDMDQLCHLKWLELKYCKNLTSLSRLPPNLQCLNAHGCTSLRTVASPLALLMPTEQIHSTFIFTNCHELEQVSKNAIVSYIHKKSELMSVDRYNQDFVFKSLISTCFTGCDIPAWFSHQALGSVLKLELPQDWNAGRFIGIAISVVVSFKDYKHQDNSLQVKCNCEFNNASLSPESFVVGGWSEQGDEPPKVESDHVFIAYTTWFNIKKNQQFSSANEVSLRFEVTNGTSVVAECKVSKCGFSLVYEPEESENTSWEATPTMEDNRQGQRSSYITAEDDDSFPNATPTTARAENNSLNKLFGYFTKSQ